MTTADATPTIHILWTGPHEEIVRKPNGTERWCFACRKQQPFEYVVLSPVIERVENIEDLPTSAWYGPIRQIECAVCKTVDGDCFPGTQREWED